MQFTFLKSSIHHHVTSHPVSKLLRVTMQVVILDEPLRDMHLVNAHEAVPMLVQALLATHVTWLHHSVSTLVKRGVTRKAKRSNIMGLRSKGCLKDKTCLENRLRDLSATTEQVGEMLCVSGT